MESMVLELQREAYQQTTSVSVLIRKAYTLSRKLKVRELSVWAKQELNGYQNNNAIPEYRVVHGEIKAFNPYRGYIPAYFQTNTSNILSERKISQPLTEIESWIEQGGEKKSAMMYKFPSAVQQDFMKMMEYPMEITLHIQISQFQKILDRIRNIILEWTLKLEEDGIMGEGMTFTEMDQKKAAESTSTIITIIGEMTNSQIQQNTSNSTQSNIIDEFKIEDLSSLLSEIKKMHKEVMDPIRKEELTSDIEVLESQIKSPNPKKGIIRETLHSVRNISEGVTGSMLAPAIQEKIMLLLPLLVG